MPNHRCCVAGCDNDSRYPEKYVIKEQVTGGLRFHYFPKDTNKCKQWVGEISKGLVGFKATKNTVVCSNHFEYGKPTFKSGVPTKHLTVRSLYISPKKRRKLSYSSSATTTTRRTEKQSEEFEQPEINEVESESTDDKEIQCSLQIALVFADLTRDSDVNFFTGLENSRAFTMLFTDLSFVAKDMHYWKGLSNTAKDLTSPRNKANVRLRKLSLEQEFLLTMMRLRLGLLIDDLAFRFKISSSLASCIFTTWIKLMSKELKWLIDWPDRHMIRRNLPSMFQKYYPKCCVIIDCSEIFIETPSSLDVAAMCWSNYKHHYTIKYLIGITPNGAVSFLSECYSGRSSDVFIVKDSNFLNCLQPNDQVMADRGFKIADLMNFYQCSLAIPPSKHTNLQMTKHDVHSTSKIANVRIYVEQAIKRMKDYRFLSTEVPILLLPHIDYIVTVCAALTNLKPPLCTD